MSAASMISFNTYVNSIELIRGIKLFLDPLLRHQLTLTANARLVYGRHLTYDVVITTKENVHVACLMAYELHTLVGKVLLVE